MFGYTYKLVTVNPEKNIVKISPTASTYVKAWLPACLFGLFWWGVFAVADSKMDEKQADKKDDTTV